MAQGARYDHAIERVLVKVHEATRLDRNGRVDWKFDNAQAQYVLSPLRGRRLERNPVLSVLVHQFVERDRRDPDAAILRQREIARGARLTSELRIVSHEPQQDVTVQDHRHRAVPR